MTCSYFPNLPVLQSGFEGCEKRLLIYFEGEGDCRSLGTQIWQNILDDAKCSILSIARNDTCTAFLLSESSLFVYKKNIMIKTCGTTTLLRCIPALLKHSRGIGLSPIHVNFSRSNFMFPHIQPDIHRSFETEVKYLDTFFDGAAVILGPLHNARWHVYSAGVMPVSKRNMADFAENSKLKHRQSHGDATFELVMFDLNVNAMEVFFRKNLPFGLSSDGSEHKNNAPDESTVVDYVTLHSGIKALLPDGVIIDAHLFDPCGYSLNAIRGPHYWTIHVTPEQEASFISFETNCTGSSWKDTVSQAITTFGPSRLGISICTNGEGVRPKLKKLGIPGFVRRNYSSHDFSKNHRVSSANFVVDVTEETQVPPLQLKSMLHCMYEKELQSSRLQEHSAKMRADSVMSDTVSETSEEGSEGAMVEKNIPSSPLSVNVDALLSLTFSALRELEQTKEFVSEESRKNALDVKVRSMRNLLVGLSDPNESQSSILSG